ncbi:hypothetical protein GCM10010394_23650 [Streptomyces crystallinus]|uniref:Uncharacterized protein n=1 Tax=Streptomyces crystallinus TaxID=68191 RepID=A0ABN1FM52_9ACTN
MGSASAARATAGSSTAAVTALNRRAPAVAILGGNAERMAVMVAFLGTSRTRGRRSLPDQDAAEWYGGGS